MQQDVNTSPTSILIVDDTPANLGAVVDTLERQGYRVFVAQDGEEAIERARLVSPDLILLDVLMPGIDGICTCQRLKSEAGLREIPVIFMTALSQMTDKAAGFAAGGVDYITKPFQLDEVLLRVDAHVKLRTLQKQLSAQNAELQQYRNHLEQMVAARTDEIRLLSYALDRVHEAVYLVDENARIVYVNDAACRALGYSAEELLAMDLFDIDPGLSNGLWEHYWRTARQFHANSVEAAHRRKDGHEFPVEINATFFSYGGKDYCLSLARDITERKQTQAALQANAEVFRAVVENAPDYIIRYDRDCRRTYINPAAAEMLGTAPTGGLQRTPAEGTTLSDAASFMTALRGVLQTGKEHAYETLYRCSNDQIRWTHMRLAPEFGPDKTVTSVLAIGRDVHDIKENELRFRTLAENFPDPIVRFDANGRISYVNPAACGDRSDTVATPLEGLYLHELRPEQMPLQGRELELAIRSTLTTGESNTTVAQWLADDGRRTFEVRCIAEREVTGAVTSVLCIGRDTTKLVEAERSLRESFTMLRNLTTRRETAREEERKRIAREIHDELGQYLTGVKFHISGLRLALGPAVETDRIDALADLADQTLRVARSLAASLRPPVLDGGIEAAIDWLADEFSRNTAVACHVVHAGERTMLAEEQAIALFRVVQESLTNVARHAAASRVTITLSQELGEFRISVSDNGHGFDTDRRPTGSLGLLGMKERMMMVGGRLAVDSSRAEGTTVLAAVRPRT